jgi:hypothetical protein
MHTTGHGQALERRFRLDNIPTLLSSIGGRNCITFARIRCDFPEHGFTSRVPAEDAYSVQTLLRSMPEMEVTVDQTRPALRGAATGSMFLFNLHTPPTVYFHDPIDSIRFYLPAGVVREAADEHGIRGFRALAPELARRSSSIW